MKWLFYVIVYVYMSYIAVCAAKTVGNGILVEPVIYGEEGYSKVGDHITFECKGTNRSMKVEWVYPNGSVVNKHIPGNRIFVLQRFFRSGPVLGLTIKQAEVHDTGVYQCCSGDHVKEVSICVFDPSQFVETKTDVNADLGRSITLTCQAKGNPEPRLLWSRNGETISEEDSLTKYRVMTKYNIQGFEGLLTITSLTPEDSGIYSCVSIQESISTSDCRHEQTHNITLNVNYAPVFADGNESYVYGKNNQQVDIACSAEGFPTPTYRWFKELPDGSLLEVDKKHIKVSEEDNKAIFTVTASYTTFDKRFKCQATNDLGTSVQYITLLKLEKPPKIDEVIVQDYTDKAVHLNVSWYEETAFPVDAFHIQYIQDKHENRGKLYTKDAAWKKSKQAEVKIDDVQPVKGTLVILPDIEPETNYYLRIRAVNDAGEGPWSTPIQVKTSVESDEDAKTSDTDHTDKTDDTRETESLADEAVMSDGTFYGIFFAGGIFVLAFLFMLAMKMVR